MPETVAESAKPKLKPTPKSGFKMPKLKEGEEIVGFRPYGHTKMAGETENFNFALQEENNGKIKTKMIIAAVLLSFIPIGLLVKNAEANFRKADLKKIAARRRLRLDEEHKVDRGAMEKDFNDLDEIYRVSEKEEIKKYMELGKTAE